LAWLRLWLFEEDRRGERLLKEWFGEGLAREKLKNKGVKS